MLKIKERGCIRLVSQRAFNQKWKGKGYKIVEDLDAEEEKFDVKEITVEIDGEKVAAQLKREWLKDKTVEELRNIAKELELTGYYNLKKDELIAEIEEAR